eukprot:237886-Hanusia_phi.AAC.4
MLRTRRWSLRSDPGCKVSSVRMPDVCAQRGSSAQIVGCRQSWSLWTVWWRGSRRSRATRRGGRGSILPCTCQRLRPGRYLADYDHYRLKKKGLEDDPKKVVAATIVFDVD